MIFRAVKRVRVRVSVAVLILVTIFVHASPTIAQKPPCIDVNTASAKELERIIHIGPERAGQIVELRKEKPFRNVDELVRVKGIAAVRLADIKKEGLACVR
jgi:DNA uptake protein ComE-like DNA-binding protein